MFSQKNNITAGLIWLAACFVVVILGSNHLYEYSFMDSMLEFVGIGSWSTSGKLSWHISAFITLPLLLLCFIQSVRYLKIRYPNIAVTLFIGTFVLIGIYPKITEQIVSFSEFLIR
ncbi:hypothetical protein RE628_19620 [Paenibacillus sp. D2_2]|uniref:hypothetical protein n=1 Tax=Paenibacillus sp. D2_2 TaxID=3073092 RepID=UPI0028155126|nr:hypothetical protein [Paenibacillus sp. D2_2]WMT39595.1 hypothetical protein RE628_19620 [Paenibacillus sp. D2_2]